MDKDLKKLNRTELLEVLVKLSEENEALAAEVATLRAQLADRRIAIQESGSLAEAALRINGFFEAAKNASGQYVENAVRNADALYKEAEELLKAAALLHQQSQDASASTVSSAQIEAKLAPTKQPPQPTPEPASAQTDQAAQADPAAQPDQAAQADQTDQAAQTDQAVQTDQAAQTESIGLPPPFTLEVHHV